MSDNKEDNSKENFSNPLENPIIYLPVYFEMMSKCDIKIFKYIWWGNKELKEIYFSERHLAKKCEVSKKTIQRFFKKYNNILIFLKRRPYKTYIISIPKVVSYYINKNGGYKIISNFSFYKEKLINLACNDPNSNDLRNSYEQDMNKKDKKMSIPKEQKCPPSLNIDYESIYLDKVLLGKSINCNEIEESEKVMLSLGLNNKEVIKVNYLRSKKSINLALDDALWYNKIGKKIIYPCAFIMNRSKEHMIKDLRV